MQGDRGLLPCVVRDGEPEVGVCGFRHLGADHGQQVDQPSDLEECVLLVEQLRRGRESELGEHLGHILGRRGGQLHRGGKPGQLQQSAFGQHRGDDFHLHFTDAARDTDLDIGLVARVCQLVTLREVVSEPLDGRGRGFGEGSRRYFGVDPVGDHRRGTVYRHARGVALVGADGEDQFPVVLVGQHVEERLAQIGRGCRAVLVGDGDALRVDRHGAAGGRRALGDQRGVDRGDVVCARREFEGQLLGSDRFFGRQHNRSHLFRRCAALHAQCEDRRETG